MTKYFKFIKGTIHSASNETESIYCTEYSIINASFGYKEYENDRKYDLCTKEEFLSAYEATKQNIESFINNITNN